ncbi:MULTISPECIES: MtrAB system histidine kinase MtrB [Microbacterium]|jgi:two-component system sensor histidine kinase MtrB|uniref:MtrAB system histidine kinase MtrB n=1 Tax=Microbacterium TaxID=33882 RepID=UPI0010F76E1A|nr:MtrAB system histidine kinase MtrB [Microbacterium sp. 4NA327F11]MCK9914937.1 MtrAB system histidine kinase MtrB [Microbacteriaceae bacterium K1510]
MSGSAQRSPVDRLLVALRGWREWPRRLAGVWRHSLRVRTVVATVALTALAVIAACVGLALAIQNDLFQSRLQQALGDASRARIEAQRTLDSSETQGDSVNVRNLMNSVLVTLSRQSSSDLIAAFRTDTAPSSIAPLDFTSTGFPTSAPSPELRSQVQSSSSAQFWQSVPVTLANGSTVPGIVVGQQLTVPGVGAYEFYIAYDLSAAAQTLAFVQGILWIVGFALVAIIAGISWLVLRSITVPVAQAAETSAKLASGDLDVRLNVRGADELATLGRSFNAMADSIQSQIKELADLSLVQQRFVSDVSHELRTPLTTIRLASDVLADRRDDFEPAAARAAELLSTQVQRFQVLLDDLLEISRYDAGSVQLEREPTSIAQLAEDVIGSMQQLADQRGSEVRLVAPGGYSLVDLDPRRVRRIVRNLLGNAIEHGEGRPIVVTVDSNQDAVALGVRDYGLGMRPEDVERVFDRFWRADPSRRRTIGGTGLGLSISLGDARLHGGTLAVWSDLGRGSNFVLTLPRRDIDGELVSPVVVDVSDETSVLDSLGLTEPIAVLAPERDAKEKR